MTAAKLDPALCRKMAHDLRANKLGGDLVQWVDRRYVGADDDTADRVAREIRDEIDGGRCEPLESFEGVASALADQLTAAADLAERKPLTEERVREVVCAAIERHYQPLSIPTMNAIAATAAKELAGSALWLGHEKTAIILQALEYWDYDLSAPHMQIAEIRKMLGGGA